MSTWKDFKDAVETAGVRDEDLVAWIDVSRPETLHISIQGEDGQRTFAVSEG